jgi:hypothetical protein
MASILSIVRSTTFRLDEEDDVIPEPSLFAPDQRRGADMDNTGYVFLVRDGECRIPSGPKIRRIVTNPGGLLEEVQTLEVMSRSFRRGSLHRGHQSRPRRKKLRDG